MGRKEVSPLPSPFVVCCMCGDHGLPQELFRCKACAVRSQHKYCSNLYPKTESYLLCNWCLRDEAGNVTAKEAAANAHNSASPSSSNNNGDSSSSGSLILKLNRGSLHSHVSKSVKKQKVNYDRPSPKMISVRSEEISPGVGRGKQVLRGKVRRYKLLEEVSS